jgi:hypothetical protein
MFCFCCLCLASGFIDAGELHAALMTMGIMFAPEDIHLLISDLGAKANRQTGLVSQEDIMKGLYTKMRKVHGDVDGGDGDGPMMMPAAERAGSLVATKLLHRLTDAVEERGGVDTLRTMLKRADTSGDGA